MATNTIEKCLKLIQSLPRIGLNNLSDLPENAAFRRQKHEKLRGRALKRCQKTLNKSMCRPPLGAEEDYIPFHLKIPREPYYEGVHVARQYLPLSLLDLQRTIDLGKLDTSKPIDLAALCNTKFFRLDLQKNYFGIHLTDEGANRFAARVNLEVQWISSEVTVAAIESNGGILVTRYFDPDSLLALVDPHAFFLSGKPIPRCKLPPLNAMEFYASPQNRGYLAKPEAIAAERLKLAQKFGYKLDDSHLLKDNDFTMRKDPRQIFYGLEPGWIINLIDKEIYKPKNPKLIEYYNS